MCAYGCLWRPGSWSPRAGGMSSCELPNLGFVTRTQSLCTHAVTHGAISQPIAYNILNRGWERINGIVMCSVKHSWEDSQKLPDTNPIFPTANPVLGERRLQETWPRQGKGSDDEKGVRGRALGGTSGWPPLTSANFTVTHSLIFAAFSWTILASSALVCFCEEKAFG